MKIYSVFDGSRIVKSFTNEAAAISFAGDTCSVLASDLYPRTIDGSEPTKVQSVYDLNGMGENLTCLIWGAGPSGNDVFKPPSDVDVHFSCNLRWHNTLIDFNVYTDQRYSQWVTSGIIPMPPQVQHIAPEGSEPASYWYHFPRGHGAGHTGKTALYIADKICRFKKIYLIGFDYTLSSSGDLHAHEPSGICNQADKDEHTTRIFECMLAEFDTTNWTPGKIFNLNRLSALKLFPYV